jgi:Ca-activated chloride channel family protein
MAAHLEQGGVMTRGKLIIAGMLVFACGASERPAAVAPQGGTVFRASVNLVRVGAIVKDKKGRFIRNLTVNDFEVLDDGQAVKITSFQRELTDVSVALLLDVSGSMHERVGLARAAASHLLSGLNKVNDEAAVFTFDSRLEEVQPFTQGLLALPERVADIKPFGATSLHDAIAQTAERLTTRGRLRRAVVVFTDGIDTASKLTAPEVSGIASAIDVPVYIIGIVPAIDNPSADIGTVAPSRTPLASTLANLATWTGGRAYIVSTADERAVAAGQILDELRQHYLMSFEASGRPGWHPLVVRTRDKDHIVRARSGYTAGQSRPIS